MRKKRFFLSRQSNEMTVTNHDDEERQQYMTILIHIDDGLISFLILLYNNDADAEE